MGILFSVAGMNKWLHRNGFSYKNRLERLINSAKRGRRNSLNYEDLKEKAGDEPVLFIDAVHPLRPPKSVMAGYEKGTGKQ